MGELRTRPSTEADAPFLLEVFTATRGPELAALGLPKAQLAALLGVQRELQQHDYRRRYPDAEQHVVEVDGAAAGELHVARRPAEMVLIDVALLPAMQRQGYGTRLLAALIAEAARAQVPLRLRVRSESPARRLYARLGFREDGATPVDVAMVLPPPAERGAGTAGATAPAV